MRLRKVRKLYRQLKKIDREPKTKNFKERILRQLDTLDEDLHTALARLTRIEETLKDSGDSVRGVSEDTASELLEELRSRKRTASEFLEELRSRKRGGR